MRVLFVTPYPPVHDGLGTYSSLIVGQLGRDGHDVRVLASRPAADPFGAEVLGALPDRPGRSDPELAAIREFSPEIIHVQFAIAAYGTRLPSLLALGRTARRMSVPLLITMHEVTRDTETLRAPGRMVYRWIGDHVDATIVHTGSARSRFAQFAPRAAARTHVIPHPRAELPAVGVSGDELRERHRLTSCRVLLAFGFIDVDKGLIDLVEALGLLSADSGFDDVRLVVAGEVRRRFGPVRLFEFRDQRYLQTVRSAIDRLGLGDRVVFTGFVPSEEVRGWFDASDVTVLPYRRSEQSGVASLASAIGTPVLTTAVGELRELSTFPTVAPADPHSLADGLRTSLSSPPSRAASRESQGDLAEIAALTTSLYDTLVRGAGSAR